MYYAEMRKYDISNGEGVRATLFVSGCTHNCTGCFNKEQQSFTYGKEWTLEDEEKFISYVKNENIIGINLLGGEPLQQTTDMDLLRLLFRIKTETNKSIWMWSGYTWEQIQTNIRRKIMLSYVDVLVDGKFEIEERDINLKFRGSKNQRVIDVQKSFASNSVVLYKEEV